MVFGTRHLKKLGAWTPRGWFPQPLRAAGFQNERSTLRLLACRIGSTTGPQNHEAFQNSPKKPSFCILLGSRQYLDPRSTQDDGPMYLKRAQQACLLGTVGVIYHSNPQRSVSTSKDHPVLHPKGSKYTSTRYLPKTIITIPNMETLATPPNVPL